MRSRAFLRRALVAVLATTVLSVGCATAQASAHSSHASVTKYGEAAVTRAFRASGIGLYDEGFGAVQPVIVLGSTKVHQGWNVAVYIYVTPAAAAESYKGSIKVWHGAGMAGALEKNVVVAVVPTNRVTIAKSATPFAMPELITQTLARLSK
jgi:hypothetical protein